MNRHLRPSRGRGVASSRGRPPPRGPSSPRCARRPELRAERGHGGAISGGAHTFERRVSAPHGDDERQGDRDHRDERVLPSRELPGVREEEEPIGERQERLQPPSGTGAEEIPNQMRTERDEDERELARAPRHPHRAHGGHRRAEGEVVREHVVIRPVGSETGEERKPVEVGHDARDQAPEPRAPIDAYAVRDGPADQRVRDGVEDVTG